MSKLIPENLFIYLSEGFNTFQGDSLRTSFDKANQMADLLDQGKANLDNPEFTGTVSGPNIIAPAGTSEYMTIEDLSFYVENSPNLISATFTGNQPTWNTKKLLVPEDIKALLIDPNYVGSEGIEISRAVFTESVKLKENGTNNPIATQHWVQNANLELGFIKARDRTTVEESYSNVLTRTDFVSLLGEGAFVIDVLKNSATKQIYQAELIQAKATDINDPSKLSGVVSKGYLIKQFSDYGLNLDNETWELSSLPFLTDLKNYLANNEFSIQKVIVSQNLEVQGVVEGGLNLKESLTLYPSGDPPNSSSFNIAQSREGKTTFTGEEILIKNTQGGFRLQGDVLSRGVLNETETDFDYYKIWDEGNMGSESGLNADLLDGNESTAFARKDVETAQTFLGEVRAPSLKIKEIIDLWYDDSDPEALNAILQSSSNLEIKQGVSYNLTLGEETNSNVKLSRDEVVVTGNTIRLISATSQLELGEELTLNGDSLWTEVNMGEGSGLDADLLDGQDGSFYTDISNFYKNRPEGNRIYVSATTGDDANFGFTEFTSVKSIKQASINAYALQAAPTREGGIRKDCYRILEANRELITEELGLMAHGLGLCGGVRDARTYRDISDLYGSLSKDLLLDTNRNFRSVVLRLIQVSSAIADSWRTVVKDELTLFEVLKDLMLKGLYFAENDRRLSADDFPWAISNYSIEWVEERLTTSSRDDSWVEDEFPCEFVRDRLREVEFPLGNTESYLPELKSPNQSNRKPFSVIRVESGTYIEDFPMELPDEVSVFGDSLRRVTIMPSDEVKQKGCGLHQRFRPNTFTRLNFQNETWVNAVDINYNKESGTSNPNSEGPLAFNSDWTELQGQVLEFVGSNGVEARGTIQQVFTRGFGNNRIARIVFSDIEYLQETALNPGIAVMVTNTTTGRTLSEEVVCWDIRNGYLLLRDEEGTPLRLSGESANRGRVVSPILTFKNQSTRFKLRKGDVLACLDLTTNFRQELVRVEEQEEDIAGGTFSQNISTVRHRLNEKFNFEDAYVYLAPRAEWQTLCDEIIKEGDFDSSNRSYPSAEVMTNSEEVGQQAFHVGNGNYIFQVNFKEHTNFSFAFRRDRPRVFASPYIQNCSSITTKGGGGILVDGFLPKQPDDDFPRRILERTTAEVYGEEWEQLHGNDIRKAINMHYDGEDLLGRREADILSVFDNNTTVINALQELESLNLNYTDIEKCKRDAKFLLDAIRWQMLKGGNDKVHDFTQIIDDAIFVQTRELEIPLEARTRVLRTYAVVLDALRDAAADAIMDQSGAPDVVSGDCTGVANTVKNLFNHAKKLLCGNPPSGKFYDGANSLYDNLDLILEVFTEPNVQTSLQNLSPETNYNDKIEKCQRDLRFLIASIAWHVARGGNEEVIKVSSKIRQIMETQVTSNLSSVLNAYNVVLTEVKPYLDLAIDNSAGQFVTAGDCTDVKNLAKGYVDVAISIIVTDTSVEKEYRHELLRKNYVALPEVKLARLQNAELRSFVLDAFTQINTFGGWGHLIRNNGYAQLVSTFTTFCDHGVKVESGGLINLSNSVCDFGFYGLIADGYSRTHYLTGEIFREERAQVVGRTPTSTFLIDPRTLLFNEENPVYKQRVEGELYQLAQSYNTEKQDYITLLQDSSATLLEKEEGRERLENLRRRLEEIAIESIQFNSTTLFDGGYKLFEGEALSERKQIPRGLAYVDRLEEVNDEALRGFPIINDPEVNQEIGNDTNLEVSIPLIRIGYLPSQRIPHNTEINRLDDPTPILEEGSKVKFFITTTLTSSAHGFEYVGSGNDYSNALPENGGVPRAENQLLETDGGRVFTSSTDVKGDFRVGPFFTVKQSTGAVRFNPSTLELINLSSIGPFTTNGVVGREIIRDLSNDWRRVVPSSISSSRGPAIDRETISTAEAIKFGLTRTFNSLSERVALSLLRTESNAKLLEALNDPTTDFGNFATKLSLFTRSNSIVEQQPWGILENELNEDTPWGNSINNMDSFLWELGGKARQDNLLSRTATTARNRSSYTLNFLVDTSESMAQSGKFWSIKQDLVDFFSGATEKDSIGLYAFSYSTADRRIIKFKGSNLFNSLNEGTRLEFFGDNSQANRRLIYIRGNNNWNNSSGRLKFGEGTVVKKIGREEKVIIENCKGLIQSGLNVGVAGGTASEIVDIVENGLEPSIHNVSVGADEIFTVNPNFNFARSIKLSLLKDVGVFFPTTKQVIEDGLLEAVVYEELRNIGFFDRPEVNLPDAATRAFIIPGADFAELDSQINFQDIPVPEITYQSILDWYNGLAHDGEPTADPYNIENSKWFYADLDPIANSNNPRVTRLWEHLASRSSVGEGSIPYNISDVELFGKYDANSNPQGFLTADVIETGGFFEEKPSKPEIDVALAVHDSGFSDRNSCREGMQGLMQSLDDSGMFDWKVGSICAKRAVYEGYLIQDFYEENVEELPRKDIFNTISTTFKETNRPAELRPGIAGRRLFAPDTAQDRRVNWYVDNAGEPDLSNSSTNSESIENANIFWIKLPSNFGLIESIPFPEGTIFELRNARQGPSTVSVDRSSILINDSITSITVSNGDWAISAGQGINVTMNSRRNPNDVAGIGVQEHTFIVQQDIPRNTTMTVPVEGTGTGKERFNLSDTRRLRGDSTNYNIVADVSEGATLVTAEDIWGVFESGDNHPLYPGYTFPFTTVVTCSGDTCTSSEESKNWRIIDNSWGWTNRLDRNSIALRVLGVKYSTKGAYLRVTTDLGGINHPMNTPEKVGWTLGSINKTFIRIDVLFQEQDVLAQGGRSDNTVKYERSTSRLISEACKELNWRPNSYKVLTVMSRESWQNDLVEWGSYYYGRNGSLNALNRLLLRRFDDLYCRYAVSQNKENPNIFYEGQAIKNAFDLILEKEEGISLEGYTNDASFSSFISSIQTALFNEGAMRAYWYLGGINDSDGNTLSYKGVTAVPGRVTMSGKVLLDNENNILSMDDYASYYACEENLLFAEIDQLHLAVRDEQYHKTGNNQNLVFKSEHYDPNFLGSLSGFTKFHDATNFSYPVVADILTHRNGTSLRDEYTGDGFSQADRRTGSGIVYSSQGTAFESTIFTEGWKAKQGLLPQGHFYTIFDVERTLFIKDLYEVIYGALGEGAGILYSEFGEANTLRPEETATRPSGFNRLKDSNLFPSLTPEAPDGYIYQDYEDTDPFSTGIVGVDGGRYSNLVEPYLIRSPYPRTLASPSIDRKLLANAGNSNISPGITLKGSSAIYESVAIMMADSSNSRSPLIDKDERVSGVPRNPARQGTININAIISDGDDTASFDDMIIKHFVKYSQNGEVNISQLERDLFEELFLDDAGNLHVSDGALVQQRYIYTNEVINTLHILAYAKSEGASQTFRIDTGIGYGSELDSSITPTRLPHRILSNDKKDNTTVIYSGNVERVRRMVEERNGYNIRDNMGLIAPFYRGSQDAVGSLVTAESLRSGQIQSSNLFPNPYRFTAFLFPVNESISTLDLNIPESSTIFAHLGEEGPSIDINIDLNAVLGNYDIIYADRDIPGYTEEDEVVLLGDVARATLYSKLGYFHSIRPDLSGQSIAVQTVVFDPGYNQRTSQASRILAQNLGGYEGTSFRNPQTITSSDQGLVLRNSNNFPIYEQNPIANLVDQRENYLTAFSQTELLREMVDGFPLISKREIDQNVDGENLGSLQTIEDTTYLFKVDRNGNNRNAIYRLVDVENEISEIEKRWRVMASTELNTGGRDIYLSKVSRVQFDGFNTATAFLKDEELDMSRILVLSDNDVWRSLVGNQSVFTDSLKDRTIQDAGQREERMPIFSRSYFEDIISEIPETSTEEGGNIEFTYDVSNIISYQLDSEEEYVFVAGTGTSDADVVKVSIVGQVEWQKTVMPGVITAIDVMNGVVYAGNSNGEITAVNGNNGNTIEGLETPIQRHTVGTTVNNIIVNNGILFSVGSDQRLRATDLGSRDELWSASFPSDVRAVASGTLFTVAGDLNGNIRVYNLDGSQAYAFNGGSASRVVDIVIDNATSLAYCLKRDELVVIDLGDFTTTVENSLGLSNLNAIELRRENLYIGYDDKIRGYNKNDFTDITFTTTLGRPVENIRFVSGLLAVLGTSSNLSRVYYVSIDEPILVSRSHVLIKQPSVLFSTNTALSSSSIDSANAGWVRSSYIPFYGYSLTSKSNLDLQLIEDYPWNDGPIDENDVLSFQDSENRLLVTDTSNNPVLNQDNEDLTSLFGPRAGLYVLDGEVSLEKSEILNSNLYNPTDETALNNRVIYLTLGSHRGNSDPYNWTNSEGIDLNAGKVELEYKFGDVTYTFTKSLTGEVATTGTGSNSRHVRTIIADSSIDWSEEEKAELKPLEHSEIYYFQQFDAEVLESGRWVPLREAVPHLSAGKGAWRRLNTFERSQTFITDQQTHIDTLVTDYQNAINAYQGARSTAITQLGNASAEAELNNYSNRSSKSIMQALDADLQHNAGDTATEDAIMDAINTVENPVHDLFSKELTLQSVFGTVNSELDFDSAINEIEHVFMISNHLVIVVSDQTDPLNTKLYAAESSGLATNPIRSHWAQVGADLKNFGNLPRIENGDPTNITFLNANKLDSRRIELSFTDEVDGRGNVKFIIEFEEDISRRVSVTKVENEVLETSINNLTTSYLLKSGESLDVFTRQPEQMLYLRQGASFSPAIPANNSMIKGAEMISEEGQPPKVAVTYVNESTEVTLNHILVFDISSWVTTPPTSVDETAFFAAVDFPLTAQLNFLSEGGSIYYPIPFKANVDPYVYPRFPHGDNWIRDGVIGVNQGQFSANKATPPDRQFSWNAPRYLRDDVWRTIRQTVTAYDSLI